MRISDWVSDVCSSDLEGALQSAAIGRRHQGFAGPSGLCHRLHGIAFRLAELLKERLLRRNVFRRPFRIFPVFSEESPAPGRWAPRPRAGCGMDARKRVAAAIQDYLDRERMSRQQFALKQTLGKPPTDNLLMCLFYDRTLSFVDGHTNLPLH